MHGVEHKGFSLLKAYINNYTLKKSVTYFLNCLSNRDRIRNLELTPYYLVLPPPKLFVNTGGISRAFQRFYHCKWLPQQSDDREPILPIPDSKYIQLKKYQLSWVSRQGCSNKVVYFLCLHWNNTDGDGGQERKRGREIGKEIGREGEEERLRWK